MSGKIPIGQLVPTADQANHAAATVYYPSDDGLALEDASFPVLGITADDCTISVEISVDRVTWEDVTHYFEQTNSGFLGGPVTILASASMQWVGWFVFADWLRVCVTYPDATNATSVLFSRRSMR